jgi:thiamine biosynthesis lipoprotein ApbE
MDAPELRKLIEKLQTEIRQTKTADVKDQEMLVQLDSEIHEFLNRSGGDKVDIPPTTVKRLEDALHHFEATHPTLTNLISQLLDDLSGAGL